VFGQVFRACSKQTSRSYQQVLTSEVGKPLQQSRNEVNGGIARITWLTANAEKYLSDEIMHSDDKLTNASAMNLWEWYATFLRGTIRTSLVSMFLSRH
jgi:acyl-CoA reductase-like NAD-dependent aldehyde dehydrogenase